MFLCFHKYHLFIVANCRYMICLLLYLYSIDVKCQDSSFKTGILRNFNWQLAFFPVNKKSAAFERSSEPKMPS